MAPDFKTSWRDLYDEICSISTWDAAGDPVQACFLFESDQRMPSRGFRPSQHGVTKKELVLERFKVQKSTPFGSDLGGQKGVISLSSA